MNGQKAMKQIALIKTGCTVEQIRPRHGDFEKWFAEGMGVSDLLQIDVFRHQPFPDTTNLSGIVITGAPAMVSDREDWSEHTAEWLAKVVPTGIPILGVCYGHQLLAHALGGRAGPNPNGRQIGTVLSQLVDKYSNDPLTENLPVKFSAQS
jgi:GMP synthase (glutamine-hydrolysing)